MLTSTKRKSALKVLKHSIFNYFFLSIVFITTPELWDVCVSVLFFSDDLNLKNHVKLKKKINLNWW